MNTFDLQLIKASIQAIYEMLLMGILLARNTIMFVNNYLMIYSHF